jgi:hypothetical protein
LDISPDGVTGWFNAGTGAPTVSFSCSDLTSGVAAPGCPGAHLFGEGADQVWSKTIYDNAGNSNSAGVSDVDVDTVAPAVNVTPARLPDLAGWYNMPVAFDTTGTDATSGVSDANCTADYNYTGPDGSGLIRSGSCTDNAGNVGNGTSAAFNFDDTDPYNVQFVGGGIVEGGSYYFGFVPLQPSSCTASDLMSGFDHCTVTPGGTAVGAQQAVGDAMDAAGNFAQKALHYTVLAWELKGFYQPVDMRTVANPNLINTVKGGSTVPLKFEIFAGATELTDVSNVKSFYASQITCGDSTVADPIEITTTGGTSLRYDSTSGQFIQNWKTPSSQIGKCYVATMTTQDGSSLSAYFKMK